MEAEFPNISGLHNIVLQQNFSFSIPSSEIVQFLHVNGSHWIKIKRNRTIVCLYDSLLQEPTPENITIIAKYLNCIVGKHKGDEHQQTTKRKRLRVIRHRLRNDTHLKMIPQT